MVTVAVVHKASQSRQAGAMSLKRFGVVAALVGVVLSVLVALVVSDALGREVSVALDKFSQLVWATAALVCFWGEAARRTGPARRWRIWMTGALGCLVLGLCAWTWGQVVLGASLPTSALAQAGFTLVPVLALGAVLVLGGGPAEVGAARGRLVLVLDGLIVVGSLFVLTWVAALESMLRKWAATGLSFLPVVAHPAAYLVLFVVLLVLSWTHRPVRQLPMLFLGLAALAQSSSGWVFAYLVSTGTTEIPTSADIGFMICPALLLLAALAPAGVRRGRADEGLLRAGELLHLLVPYLPMAATGLFVVVGTATGTPLKPLEIYVGLGVVGLVVLRQLLTLIDNVRLVEQLRDSRERLRHQAYHDPLTGLPNRALFRERLAAALCADGPIALLFIDVDGFKEVNDNYGHAEGDAVLRIVAQRLQRCVRECDTVARLGGDEFGVLIEGDAPPDEVGQRVLRVLVAPHRTALGEHRIRASVGIARRAHGQPVAPDDLLGDADAAMYAAKRLGKGIVVGAGGGQIGGPVGAIG
ncbi:diguanylate cyclase domain-containing protein [Actinosynnema pretiosum]|uniref:GGDEF domain-containing protein n=1 Tax=Actinosynnema pretiosum TaxID=42197 RepID=A0A290Z2U5_9PSEU|nr:diguanylate cyclase [Actinosynnema pretiosum]ATE53314.1 GGDEF domain-containing protein [Actinosynnema pretiosum]